MKPPLTFATSHLRLHPVAHEDAPATFDSYARDLEVTRFVTWRAHPNVEVTRRFIAESCLIGRAAGGPFTPTKETEDSQ